MPIDNKTLLNKKHFQCDNLHLIRFLLALAAVIAAIVQVDLARVNAQDVNAQDANAQDANALDAAVPSEVSIVDDWRYTLRKPAKGWQDESFDDSQWKSGSGGFGTRDTPGARVGTVWATNRIWLRKSFPVQTIPQSPALLMHHDEDASVWINGKQVAEVEGFSKQYKLVKISSDAAEAIRVGKNVMAVRCSQTGGGQFIDVHLVDAKSVPQLPAAKRDTKPFHSELITKWGSELTAQNAWTEYPRPQLRRDNWANLNGTWQYAVTEKSQQTPPEKWTGEILVPFCLESKLGGVQRLLDASEALWYRRTFTASTETDMRQLLNFEAVDYRCEVFVNGQSVGKHQGGNTPFQIDVTDAIGAIESGSSENELIVRVEDETEKFQLRGKQTLNARGIWYTQVSGIWQTVWMEQVASNHITDLKITTDAGTGSINVKPVVKGRGKVRVTVMEGDRIVASGEGSDEIRLRIADAKLWSPSSPHLYDIEATLLDESGRIVDRVASYAGIRSVGKVKDSDGHLRFTLNGNVVFHWGPLDQGWWPDGLLTPPSDEAMLGAVQRSLGPASHDGNRQVDGRSRSDAIGQRRQRRKLLAGG